MTGPGASANVGIRTVVTQIGQELLTRQKQQLMDLAAAGKQATGSAVELNAAQVANMRAAQQMAGVQKEVIETTEVTRNAFAELAEGIRTASADYKAGIISQEEYQLALKDSRAVALDLRRETGSLAGKELSSFNQVLSLTSTRAVAAGRGSGVLRSALTQLAFTTLGTSSSVGRLVQGLLFFASGAGLSIAVIGGLAAIAFGIQSIGQHSRETNASLDDTIKKYQQLGQTSVAVERRMATEFARQTAIRSLQGQLDVAEQQGKNASGGWWSQAMQGMARMLSPGLEAGKGGILDMLSQAAQDVADKGPNEAKERIIALRAELLRVQAAGSEAAQSFREMKNEIKDQIALLGLYGPALEEAKLQQQGLTQAEAHEIATLHTLLELKQEQARAVQNQALFVAGLHNAMGAGLGGVQSFLSGTSPAQLAGFNTEEEYRAATFLGARDARGRNLQNPNARNPFGGIGGEGDELSRRLARSPTTAMRDREQERIRRRYYLPDGSPRQVEIGARDLAGAGLEGLGQALGGFLGGQSVDTKRALAENAAAVKELNQAFADGKINAQQYQEQLAQLADEKRLALSRANPLRQFAANMTGTLGTMLQELGKAMIGMGLAGEAIKKFITNPVLAVVAGTALIALGGALARKAQGIADAGGSAIAGGGGGSSSAGIGAGSFSDAQQAAQKGEVNFYFDGEFVLDPTNTTRVDQFTKMIAAASDRRVGNVYFGGAR